MSRPLITSCRRCKQQGHDKDQPICPLFASYTLTKKEQKNAELNWRQQTQSVVTNSGACHRCGVIGHNKRSVLCDLSGSYGNSTLVDISPTSECEREFAIDNDGNAVTIELYEERKYFYNLPEPDDTVIESNQFIDDVSLQTFDDAIEATKKKGNEDKDEEKKE